MYVATVCFFLLFDYFRQLNKSDQPTSFLLTRRSLLTSCLLSLITNDTNESLVRRYKRRAGVYHLG